MRKLVAVTLCTVLAASLLPLAGCSEKAEKEKYVMNLEYFPEERTLQCEMEASIPNLTENALEEIKFELWANAYREGAKYSPVSELYRPSAYYKGESWGGIEISSVTGAQSFAISGEDQNLLQVKLNKPLYPDESVKLTMSFTVTLAEVNHRLGVGENTVTLSHFYPVRCLYGENGFREYVYSCYGDPFVNDCADFDVTLTVPEEYEAAYGGKGECVAQNGKKAYHVITENARETAFVLSRNFQTVSKTESGKEISYYYFNDETPDKALDVAGQSLNYFSKTFGEYNSDCYTVVQADFPYGGMEYAGMSLISSSLHASDIPLVVAHETAHQWWYSQVGSNQFECAWQDEGLAEYSTALFFEAHPDYGMTYADMVAASEKSYRAFFSVYSQINGEANTKMNRPLTSYSGEYEYRNIAYDKGVILFSRLRSVLGDSNFFGGLKRYASRYNGKIASYEDLVSCFAGASAEGVFDSFTQGLCVI